MEKEKLRQQDKVILWSVYFDSAETRSSGRRVPRLLAVVSPRVQEIKEAADKLGLNCEIAPDAGYPKTPWSKTGTLLVKKKGSKDQTIFLIAKQLLKMRNATPEKP